jgi:hypothetical protein
LPQNVVCFFILFVGCELKHSRDAVSTTAGVTYDAQLSTAPQVSMVRHLPRKEEVVGSIPTRGSFFLGWLRAGGSK